MWVSTSHYWVLVDTRVYTRVRPMLDAQEESLGMGIEFTVSHVLSTASSD